MNMYSVKFKKKFGQNFLKNKNTVKKIVDVSDIDKDSLVVEVGPGSGVMTKELALRAKNVLAYEIDNDLAITLNEELQDFDNVDILFHDFLTSELDLDISNYSYKKLYFVSNVPYYITTPIIMKLIESKLKFDKIVMMVQKEVGDRFTSPPGSREYGSISVLLNYYYDVNKEFFVSKKEFIPEPKVDSVVISFTEKKDKLEVKDLAFFETILKESFQFKRKNIKNNLKKYDLKKVEHVLNEYNYDLTVRAENLSLEIFVDLANTLYENR